MGGGLSEIGTLIRRLETLRGELIAEGNHMLAERVEQAIAGLAEAELPPLAVAAESRRIFGAVGS